ncbi:hypothetical protein VKT23_007564 [Stygiomarasmius scandens]|uniref:DUF6534 domain-containing protein n=1 Tax=Marasmiellus scandens TaxID=2682957 RepID=A0ABR1JN12_9AGAR
MSDSSIQNLAIPLLLGHLVSCILHGALLVQVYFYFVNFLNDKKKTKALVLVLLMLENIQTVLVVFDAISAFAENFGRVDELEKVRLQWLSVPVLSALISCPVQLFFANRVRILSHSKKNKAAIVITIFSVAQGAASLAGGISQGIMNGKVTDLQGRRFSPVVAWLAMTCLCDVSIAVSMIYYLRAGDSDFKPTQILLQRVKRLTLETGAVTAGMAVMTLMLWVVFHDHTYWATPASVITKVYSNSLLASLNSRVELKRSMGGLARGAGGGKRRGVDIESGGPIFGRRGKEGTGSGTGSGAGLSSVYMDWSYDSSGSGSGSGSTALRGLGYDPRRSRNRGTYDGLGGQWVVSPVSGKLREESIRLEPSPVEEQNVRRLGDVIEERTPKKGKQRFSWISLSQVPGLGCQTSEAEGEKEIEEQPRDGDLQDQRPRSSSWTTELEDYNHIVQPTSGPEMKVSQKSNSESATTHLDSIPSRERSSGFSRLQTPLRVRTTPLVVGDLERPTATETSRGKEDHGI